MPTPTTRLGCAGAAAWDFATEKLIFCAVSPEQKACRVVLE